MLKRNGNEINEHKKTFTQIAETSEPEAQTEVNELQEIIRD
jgi:hypothetical protein